MSLSSTEIEALENQAFNLMSRLHVTLRRENGRVTDIKYMATNPEYCAHVLGVASRVPNIQLQEVAERLGDIYFGENGLFSEPNFRLAKPAIYKSLQKPDGDLNKTIAAKATAMVQSLTEHSDIKLGSLEQRSYVGRLR